MKVVSAKANTLIDSNGKQWLDLQSGILNTPFGHGSAVIEIALREIIASGHINTYDRAGQAQEDLLDLIYEYGPPEFTWKPFNTGAEAIEKAIQVAATYFGRLPKIAVLDNSFHGKMLSMAYANYGDKLPWGNPLNIIHVDPYSKNERQEFDVLIYEPIQGWDGILNDEAVLRAMCDKRGALLIADEMITSFMRCGKRFMSIDPDMIVCGKGISAGVPLSMLGFRPILYDHGDTIPVGWRTTGAGNNLAMVIGRASLEMLIDTENKITEKVEYLEHRLRLMGFNAVGAFGFKTLSNHEATKAYFEEEGIIASWHCPPQMRVGPSFVTTAEDLDRLQETLRKAGEL